MKIMKLGIMNREDFRQYTIDIAKGQLKPAIDAPKVWFDSLESLAQVLSAPNRKLLKLIKQHHPQSLAELAKLSGRKKESLSRTLHTMNNYGIVTLEQGKRCATIPHVVADSFS